MLGDMSLPDRVVEVWDSGLFRLLLVVATTFTITLWIVSDSLDDVSGLTQPTATLVAGLAASLGSVLIGVLALYFAWRNTQATLRQQALLSDRQEVAKLEADVHMAIAATGRSARP